MLDWKDRTRKIRLALRIRSLIMDLQPANNKKMSNVEIKYRRQNLASIPFHWNEFDCLSSHRWMVKQQNTSESSHWFRRISWKAFLQASPRRRASDVQFHSDSWFQWLISSFCPHSKRNEVFDSNLCDYPLFVFGIRCCDFEGQCLINWFICHKFIRLMQLIQ